MTSTPGGLVVIHVAVATASVGEAAGSLTVVVQMTVAQLVPISVDFATTSFTAMAHSDFAFTNGTITFAPGQTSAEVAVPILDDLLVEGDEQFNITLYDPRPAAQIHARGKPGLMMLAHQIGVGDGVTLGEPSSELVTIVDNDGGTPVVVAGEVCLVVPPTTTAGITPFPTLQLELPTLRPLPALPGYTFATTGTELVSATNDISPVATLVMGWAAPAATFSAWSVTNFGEDGAVKGQQDADLLTAQIGSVLGWLGIFTMLGGPFLAILPGLLIRLDIRIARGVLRILRYLRAMLPR